MSTSTGATPRSCRVAEPRSSASARLVHLPDEPSSTHFFTVDLSGASKHRFGELLDRFNRARPVQMYDAIEQGVPTSVVLLIADAFETSKESVMKLIGVSESTFRRKEEARDALPEVAGHRMIAFLRIVAKLSRLLDESGDPEQMKTFDLEAWVKAWLGIPMAEFGGKTPAEMLRNPEGQRAVEESLERMRGGLPA